MLGMGESRRSSPLSFQLKLKFGVLAVFTLSSLISNLTYKYQVDTSSSVASAPQLKEEENLQTVEVKPKPQINDFQRTSDEEVQLPSRISKIVPSKLERKLTKVFVLPGKDYMKANKNLGELRHFILSGIQNSPLLEQAHDADDPNAIWVVDLVRCNCHLDLIPMIKDRYKRATRTTEIEEISPWSIYLVDFNDNLDVDTHCLNKIYRFFEKRNALNSKPRLFLAARKHVYDRDIVTKETGDDMGNDDENSNDTNTSDGSNTTLPLNETVDFHFLGEAIDYAKEKSFPYLDGAVRVLRYGVRGDLADSIGRVFQKQQNMTDNHSDNETKNLNSTISNIIDKPRRKDAIHFWEIGSDRETGKLRDYVSNALLAFNEEAENQKMNYTITARKFGARYAAGRNAVQDKYTEALLEYKIIVVCQRDYWEGHYRLMEALAAGAMVMTDPMHPLPYHIEDGKQVIVYKNIAEFKKYLKYYLEHDEERLKIARSGNDIAMRFHQSREWMERLLFGDWTTLDGGEDWY